MITTVLVLLGLRLHSPISPATAQDVLPRRGALGMSFTPLPASEGPKYNLKPGEGLVSQAPVPGLTGEKAGLKAGDIILSINGKTVATGMVAKMVRELPAGQPIKFAAIRDGRPLDITTNLMERPRDPGNANYEVVYTHITSNGLKMRTIITKPKKAGKFPALMFIQGFAPLSYDYKLEGSSGDVPTLAGPILYEFANTGYVTLRVEKPGVGDSEGGPFADVDYTTELDIYRQAMKQLKSLEAVDADKVFIFGHSMGGAFGPMIATETPVKGIAVYGSATRTWKEYLMDTIRYQGLLAGGSYANADESVRLGSRVADLIFIDNMTAEQVKKAHPELAQMTDELFPGGLFSGKTSKFWGQLQQTNFAAYWEKVNSRVLSIHGASDFVTYDVDHKLTADIVNRAHPGWGKFVVLPNADHFFHNWPTEAEALKNYSKGPFNPAVTKLIKEWADGVLAGKG